MSLLIAALAAIAAPAAAPAPLDGALGANFNEHYEDVDFAELHRANDRWVRGFLTMPQIDPADAGSHIAIRTSLDAEQRGFPVILTLKWPMKRSGIPTVGSQAFARAEAKLDAVLPLVMGKVAIIEIGNEPFIEAARTEWDHRLNDFYEAMAHRIIDYRAQHCAPNCKTRLFMGALNNLEYEKWKTPATARWLEFARETKEIDGVDIHPHVHTLKQAKAFIDYVLPRLRPDQTFLATEFSLVHHWKQHLGDRVPASFARTYHVAPKTLVWQEIAAAITKPVPQREWNDFLMASPWFATRCHYLARQMAMFRDTGRLAVATYGFKQGRSMTHHFDADSTPWLLNSVIAGRTVQPHADGTAGTNPCWFDDFRQLATPAR